MKNKYGAQAPGLEDEKLLIELTRGLSDRAVDYLAHDFRMDHLEAPQLEADQAAEVDSTSGSEELKDPGLPVQPQKVTDDDDSVLSELSSLVQELQHKENELFVTRKKLDVAEQTATMYYATFHAIARPMLLVKPESLMIMQANNSASALLSTFGRRLKGQMLRNLVSPVDRAAFDSFLIALLSETPSSIDISLNMPGGSAVPLSITGSAVKYKSQIIGFVLQLH